ncbi:MAG: hypothetical protein GF335_00420 [Candidatus Moranbacteria bacterium]|nr:hypothetical protein [Candidatus Moranbacteria bacterium]
MQTTTDSNQELKTPMTPRPLTAVPGGPLSQEKARIKKKYTEELESLRREEQDMVTKFGLELDEKVLINSWHDNFTFEKNLEIFNKELAQTEEKLFNLEGDFDQHEKNQTLSKLRILKEKGKTAYDRAQNLLKKIKEK